MTQFVCRSVDGKLNFHVEDSVMKYCEVVTSFPAGSIGGFGMKPREVGKVLIASVKASGAARNMLKRLRTKSQDIEEEGKAKVKGEGGGEGGGAEKRQDKEGIEQEV